MAFERDKIYIRPKNASVPAEGVSAVLENSDALTSYIRAFHLFGDEKSLEEVGNIAKDTFNQYVPKRNGRLRRRAKVNVLNDVVTVDWNTVPYAHYQYIGEIYDFNHVYFRKGVVAGWYSSAEKKPSGRMMIPNFRYTLYTKGDPIYRMGYDKNGRYGKIKTNSKTAKRYICRLGYTTPDTGHHWIEEVINTPTTYTPMKRQMTRYLYEKFQENFGGKAVGT